MSEYTFKNLNEIDTVKEPADGTTMMGFQNGTPIQMPMSAVKGGGGVFLINSAADDYSTTDTSYGNKVRDALQNGNIVWIYEESIATTTSASSHWNYTLVYRFIINKTANTTANTTSEATLTVYFFGPSSGNTPLLEELTFPITVEE